MYHPNLFQLLSYVRLAQFYNVHTLFPLNLVVRFTRFFHTVVFTGNFFMKCGVVVQLLNFFFKFCRKKTVLFCFFDQFLLLLPKLISGKQTVCIKKKKPYENKAGSQPDKQAAVKLKKADVFFGHMRNKVFTKLL